MLAWPPPRTYGMFGAFGNKVEVSGVNLLMKQQSRTLYPEQVVAVLRCGACVRFVCFECSRPCRTPSCVLQFRERRPDGRSRGAKLGTRRLMTLSFQTSVAKTIKPAPPDGWIKQQAAVPPPREGLPLPRTSGPQRLEDVEQVDVAAFLHRGTSAPTRSLQALEWVNKNAHLQWIVPDLPCQAASIRKQAASLNGGAPFFDAPGGPRCGHIQVDGVVGSGWRGRASV